MKKDSHIESFVSCIFLVTKCYYGTKISILGETELFHWIDSPLAHTVSLEQSTAWLPVEYSISKFHFHNANLRFDTV